MNANPPLSLADGTRLAWESAGEGPVVLLVHGIGSSRRKWEPQVAPLVSLGYRVVRFDLRGFGDSTTPPAPNAMGHFLGDLVALVEALQLETFHLVGHSLGGMIAQRFALDHPGRVRTLALASTTSHNGRRANAFARLMVSLGENGFDAVVGDERLRREAEVTLAEAFPGGLPLGMLRRGVEEPNLARANAWRACIDFSTKDRLAELRCPALVTHGTADALIPFKAGELVARAIAGARWVPHDGAGHGLPHERPEAFHSALAELLEGSTACASPAPDATPT